MALRAKPSTRHAGEQKGTFDWPPFLPSRTAGFGVLLLLVRGVLRSLRHLGHVNPVSTQYYLQFTPELRPSASQRFHRHFAYLFTVGAIFV